MLTLKDFSKVLVQYARTKTKITPVLVQIDSIYDSNVQIESGKKIGVVVSIDKDVLGWSLCNKKDKFDKDRGLSIALGRAALASEMSLAERIAYYEQVPQSLMYEFKEMEERSRKYFL